MLRLMQLLVLLAACAVGGMLAGALGALAAGAACLLVARIPALRHMPSKVQWVLLPTALLVMGVAASAGRSQQRVAAVGDPVPAATTEDWDAVAGAFERNHPELKLGSNAAIMQRAVNAMAQPGIGTADLLARSYAAATQTTGWIQPPPATIAASINAVAWDEAAAAPAPRPAPEPTLLQVVVQDAQDCQSAGGNPMNCYSSASPDRCKAAAVAMVGNPDLNRRTWGLCVQSCAEAGLWSRTVGDCHR